jgi:inner membrane protein
MASIGHIAVGMAAGRACARSLGPRLRIGPAMVALSALALLPDLDVVAFRLGIPYGAPFGHRGAAHSLVFALALGLVAALVARPLGLRPLCTLAVVSAVVASHGPLDARTDAGRGVARIG